MYIKINNFKFSLHSDKPKKETAVVQVHLQPISYFYVF